MEYGELSHSEGPNPDCSWWRIFRGVTVGIRALGFSVPRVILCRPWSGLVVILESLSRMHLSTSMCKPGCASTCKQYSSSLSIMA